MNEPIWILRSVVDAIHDIQLAENGGASGIRDEGLLESALARPRNVWGYGELDPFVLAGAYAFGIARNHPFVDGNKRTALLVAYVLLGLNGFLLTADEFSATRRTLSLAAGESTEADFSEWLRSNSKAK